MSGIVKPHLLLPDLLQISEEGRILDDPVEGERELTGSGVWSRELLGAGDGILEDEVHPLARALDHAAALEDLGEAAVSWSLPIEQGFHRDLGQEAAGALDRESGGEELGHPLFWSF